MSCPHPATSQPLLFPAIECHGIIGDRRTGALVAADGTVDWFCAPDYDSEPLFSLLLDPSGGYCRLGPSSACVGIQSYEGNSATLLTRWELEDSKIELADVMAWPEDDKAAADRRRQRVILRRIRVTGRERIHFEWRTGRGFASNRGSGACANGSPGFWSSFACDQSEEGAVADISVQDAELWCAVGWNLIPDAWSVSAAQAAFEEAKNYWLNWCSDLKVEAAGVRQRRIYRSAIIVQLLGHAHSDSVAAALTTSLPERIGGDRNYDYRYAWVRDASLSLALLARLGKEKEVSRYLEWLCQRTSTCDMPLMVCYRMTGEPLPPEEEIEGLSGYRQSLPVRCGNKASLQRQHGSLGFFADCARLYLDRGGEWKEEFWHLICRAANYTCDHWREPDNGVWELPRQFHFVASRVMSWVVLDRSVDVARRTGHRGDISRWEYIREQIHEEVMEKGWCPAKESFRQRYDSDALDAAALLIPLMGFLPADHAKVLSTLDALDRELSIDGLLHRFKPGEILAGKQAPLGEFEGAFLPAVFWQAHALAKAGRCSEAEAILQRCETVAESTGLFAEEIQAHQNCFLGNMPLVFAHVEYVRAVFALHEARARSGNSRHETYTE